MPGKFLFIGTIAFVLTRFIICFFWDQFIFDFDLSATMLVLVTGLHLGDRQAKNLKKLLENLKQKFNHAIQSR
jgi:hypothetical protein